jgi:serine O-acetyltransferase
LIPDFVRQSLRDIIRRPASTPTADARGANGSSKDERPANDLPLREILAEDFSTHDRQLLEPGLWAVAVHRLGERLDRIQPAFVRRPAELSHKILSTAVDWVWGINLPRTTQLGRRVRLWHSGSMLLDAGSIGDDVQIRHGTTFGPVRAADPRPASLPVIEAGADIGSGACILGGITVGKGATVGANSVVLEAVAPGARVIGVPARAIPNWIVKKK